MGGLCAENVDKQDIVATRFCSECGSELYSGDTAFCCCTEIVCEECFYEVLKLIKKECMVDVY